jgi:hypothetical protein
MNLITDKQALIVLASWFAVWVSAQVPPIRMLARRVRRRFRNYWLVRRALPAVALALYSYYPWTFWPVPSREYRFYYRDHLLDGTSTAWRTLLPNSATAFRWIWNPRTPFDWALQFLAQNFVSIVRRDASADARASKEYRVFANLAQAAQHHSAATGTEFRLAPWHGHVAQGNPTDYLSGVIPLSEDVS